MDNYEPIQNIESPFPIKPDEPNVFNLPCPGEYYKSKDTNVYPKE